MNSPVLTNQNLKDLLTWLTVFGSLSLLWIGKSQPAGSAFADVYFSAGGFGLLASLVLSEFRRRAGLNEIRDLREAATSDPLTKVGNRRAFETELNRQVALFRRYRGNCSLLVIDTDHFKTINDEWGHAGGDLALQAIAKAIRATLRDIDLLYRFGGDEFVAILPETKVEEAAIAGERIRQAVSQVKIRMGDQAIRFTVSVGCAQLLPTDNQENWLNRADEALFHAKRSGRNRVQPELNCQSTQVAPN